MRPSFGSSTTKRPPTAMAVVAMIRPFSIKVSLVVPPPISTLSKVTPWPRDSATAPEPLAESLALHMVPGRGADELAGLLREQVGDGARVAALDGLAGEDDRAAVDLVAFDARHRRSSRR